MDFEEFLDYANNSLVGTCSGVCGIEAQLVKEAQELGFHNVTDDGKLMEELEAGGYDIFSCDGCGWYAESPCLTGEGQMCDSCIEEYEEYEDEQD